MKRLSTLLILYLLSMPSFALNLIDGNSFNYDIGKDGALMQGSLDAYNGMYYLRVNGTSYQGTVSHLSQDGREAFLTTFTEPTTGLTINRRIYVSKTENFARYIDVLQNPTGQTIEADVEIHGYLGAGKQTIANINQAQFLVTSNNLSNTMPVLLHYHSHSGSDIAATHALNNGFLNWQYPTLKIPAYQTVALTYFIGQMQDVKTARIIANYIYENPTTLYENAHDISDKIINFTPPKAKPTQDFSQATFLNLEEVRRDELKENAPYSHQRLYTPADFYVINLKQGQTVSIQMAAAFNAYLYIFGDKEGKKLLMSNDDKNAETTNADIQFTAPTDGNYYIEATTHNRYGKGNYSILVTEKIENNPPHIHDFLIISDSFATPSSVTFTDLSVDIDGSITQRCWQFDDSTAQTCHQDSHQATHNYQQAGHYTVGLTVYDNHNNTAYHSKTLTINNSKTGIVLPISNTAKGDLSTNDDYSQTRSQAFADRYRITPVTAGEKLVIDMQSEDFDSFLYLYDTANRRLRLDNNSGENNHARIYYTPMTNDDLFIEATSFADKTTGTYDLSVAVADDDNLGNIHIDMINDLNNPLQNLFVARLPENFTADFLKWEFNDGSQPVITSDAVVSHRFNYGNTFTVNVTATNHNKETITSERTFSLQRFSNLPTTHFTASPLFGDAPLQVYFTNETNLNIDEEDVRYIWQFGDGTVSTEKHPIHIFEKEGVYPVTLQTYLTKTQQSVSYHVPISVIDRNSYHILITNKTRTRPQVLIAGFDPILIDLLDTQITVFAIVRAGSSSLKTVRAIRKGDNFNLVMQHVATYANGDQRYEAIYNFPAGTMPVLTRADFFGDQTGQYQIQVTDQAGQFHSFPNLEVTQEEDENNAVNVLYIEPLKQAGIRRHLPQILGAGFDPALVDITDSEFLVKAIVRAGLNPIQTVVLEYNAGGLNLPMKLLETLPNGDNVYGIIYTYPQGSLEKTTFGELFGDKLDQFSIIVTDQKGKQHRFPELKVGNYPQK